MVLSAKLSVQVIRSLILLPANVEKSQEAQAWNYVNQKKQVIFAASNHIFDPLQTLFIMNLIFIYGYFRKIQCMFAYENDQSVC